MRDGNAVRFGWIVSVAVLTAASGFSANAQQAMPWRAAHAIAAIGTAGLPTMPAIPKPFTIPNAPIVAADSDGYLPSSWQVTPKGEFAYSIPLAVPPGRLGMSPALSIDYVSGSGQGVVGFGWTLTGFSRITRGGRIWARHGTTDGVDYTTRDRFLLDGQELAVVNATPYGGDGAEYRTVSDTFVRVRSSSTQKLDPLGPEQFTVELGDGRVRTYEAVTAQRITFDNANKVFAHGPVRAEWRIASERDAFGNTMSYEYEDTTGPGGVHAADYWYETHPSKILYTANLTNGQPTHGPQDLPQRYVTFDYENRPDARSDWTAGVQRRQSVRLKTIGMHAPNPTATNLVWQYNLAYTLSASQRSLLRSVQRCESVGGCLWAKQFAYSPGAGVLFQTQPIVPAPIAPADYDFTLPSAVNGEVPAMVTLDLNGDGAGDLLFGTGAKTLWEQQYLQPPFGIWVPDGNFLGKSHSLWLSQRDANGVIQPLAQGLSLARDEEPLASANYGHVRLDAATGVDLDGDGKDELVAMIDNTGAHEINQDPKLPPLYDCSYVDLKWTASGFVHTSATPCTLLGTTNGVYKYYLPNEFPTFADFNGDGLTDRASPYNTAGWIGSNNPNDFAQFEYSPAWQIALNDTAKPGQFVPPVQYGALAASPGVVTDLDGDGRPELTSEALKSSLTFDDTAQWIQQVPDSVHLPPGPISSSIDGYREFGDFNGDGLEDELLLTRTDPSRPGVLTAQIYWNTGRGFYPDTHTTSMPVDVHPDVANNIATRFSNIGIHVSDLDNDGRADVVIFNNDHKDAKNQPAPQVVSLLSNGDGTFTELDLPVKAGTRDDVKYALDNTLQPIVFYPDRLDNDVTRVALQAVAQLVPGADALLQGIPLENVLVPGPSAKTPGFAAGWNLATLDDVNGDGLIDIVRHVGGNDPAGGFEIMEQVPQWRDELVSVTDEATAWPALSIEYSSEPSDRPEVDDSYTCAYPLSCPKNGLRVVRAISSRAGLTDVPAGEDPLKLGHTFQWSYRDPVANRQGLGFFGFSEVRMWDAEPLHPHEIITTFDLRTPDASGAIYPGVGVPATVTNVQPILAPVQGQPPSATARIARSTYTYELRFLNGGVTHAVFPQQTHTSEWEQNVAIAWAGDGPDHLHVSGYTEPANPPIHVDSAVTVDDYGNVIDATTQTVGGLKSDVATPTDNDLASWHLGLVSERSISTTENPKNAVPVTHTTDFTYTPQGEVASVAIEKNNADASIPSTTTTSYDDYGQITSSTTTVTNEPPRTLHFDYSNAWPGAPDEHTFVGEMWADHSNPLCAIDCRPASWTLTHPAYGLAVATMDRDGVQSLRSYDGHGRLANAQVDGELPIAVTYAGRPDAFGGMNGVQSTITTGLQQAFRTFDARGAVLRSSLVGFDGQWINTFFAYDALGRRVKTSRPSAGAPVAWTVADYDSLGRDVATTFPDGSSTTRTYDNFFETEHTDAGGHYGYEIYDVDGRLTQSAMQLPPGANCGVCLAQDVKTTFAYGATATGATETALDDQGNATHIQFDRRGRAIQQDEPSRGTTTVAYNGFGEATQTVFAATGDTETNMLDDLGRVLTTTTTADGTTTYTWDVADNGVGRLARAISPDHIKTAYRYDTLGRVAGLDQTDDTAHTDSLDFGYDAQTGRLSSVDYPLAPGQPARFRAAYAYNGYGYLKTVTNATPNQPATILQQITARNADLALVDASRGIDAVAAGGPAIDDHREYDPLMGRLWDISARHAGANRLDISYNYDPDGLVSQRNTTDEQVQIVETFQHDALHRLIHATRDGMPLQNGLPFSATVDETYDTIGNRVDTSRNGQLVEHRVSGANGSQPYALTQRTIVDPANPNQPPQTLAYQYDALGRLQKDAHRVFNWTSFDLPKSVTEDGQAWSFLYNADRSRVKKIGADGTITYFDGLYEKRETAQLPTRHVFHVIGGDETVADVTYTEAASPNVPGTIAIEYPLTDALGSTNAVVDGNGTTRERDYYDAWGLRSNADGTALANLSLFQSLSSAGFTSQPHDDDLGLVDMHGRIYEPTLGRFLSADPVVGNPAYSQSWNSYSYVLNSPANFTDASGFECNAPSAVAIGGEKTFIMIGECAPDTIPVTAFENGDYGSENIFQTAGSLSVASVGAVGAAGFALNLARISSQTQANNEVNKGHAWPNGTKIRNADGSPFPSRRNDNSSNAITDNWGNPIPHGVSLNNAVASAPKSDHPLVKYAANFSVRLFCGSKCASASAPNNKNEALQAPRQLSTARNVRNAVSQALAARAVFRFLGKFGVLIDEGVDGLIDRLTPPALGMTDDSGPSNKPSLQLLPYQEGDDEELSPEEELEVFRNDYNEALKQYGFYAAEVSELKLLGLNANKYGTPLWLLEQHQKSWGEALDEAGATLKAVEAKIKRKDP